MTEEEENYIIDFINWKEVPKIALVSLSLAGYGLPPEIVWKTIYDGNKLKEPRI